MTFLKKIKTSSAVNGWVHDLSAHNFSLCIRRCCTFDDEGGAYESLNVKEGLKNLPCHVSME